ncbi:MAG: hypothetical protein ACFCU6_14605, partial [Balneolaceae bacterium]
SFRVMSRPTDPKVPQVRTIEWQARTPPGRYRSYLRHSHFLAVSLPRNEFRGNKIARSYAAPFL